MICNKCGAPIPAGITVCPYCGAQVGIHTVQSELEEKTAFAPTPYEEIPVMPEESTEYAEISDSFTGPAVSEETVYATPGNFTPYTSSQTPPTTSPHTNKVEGENKAGKRRRAGRKKVPGHGKKANTLLRVILLTILVVLLIAAAIKNQIIAF